MNNDEKNLTEEDLRVQLIEALLAYLEGRRTFRSVLILGVNFYNFYQPFEIEFVAETIKELNNMGNQLANGKKFSKEEIKETFTTFLEHLVPK